MQTRLQKVVASRTFHSTIIVAILVAAALVGLETYPSIKSKFGDFIRVADKIIVGLFTLEILIKLGALGSRWRDFFKDSWNVFDFVIVSVCFLPFNAHYVAVLRLARILRVIRIFSAVRKLQVLVNALLKSIPSMAYVSVLMLVIFYIYGCLATFIFGDNDPIHFRTLGISLISLFRVVTLEDWTDILYTQMYSCSNYGYTGENAGLCQSPEAFPAFAPIFFISFGMLGTMIVLNLFIGVVLNSMSEAQQEAERRDRNSNVERRVGNITLINEIHSLADDLQDLRKRMIDIQQHLETTPEEEQPRMVLAHSSKVDDIA